MSDENSVPNKPCETESHRQHLCKLTGQFFHLNSADEFRVLVDKPQFKCLFCGRTANSDRTLCYPEKL
jgi:hypothetical protein